MSDRQAAIRRLLGDLRRSETRSQALHRVRSKATREVRRRTGGNSTGTSAGGTATGTTSNAPKRPDAWYVGEWQRLAGTVFGSTPTDDAPRRSR